MNHEELHKYLNTLIRDFFLFILRLNEGLTTIQDWFLRKPEGVDALNIGASFFRVMQKSFKLTLWIELYKFIEEKRSLRHFLAMAKKNATNLTPTRYSTEAEARIAIPIEEYKNITVQHLKRLNEHKGTISNLRVRRKKAWAHTDPSFFDNPDELYKNFPLYDTAIESLIQTIAEILRHQALFYGEGDLDLSKVYTTNNLDRLLKYVRAYDRIKKDEKVYEKGILAFKYLDDDYTKLEN